MNYKTIEFPFSFKKSILAVGGELKNTFCLTQNNRAFISEPLGDLENIEALTVFENSINAFNKKFKINPKIIACDLHPEYLSTKFALDYVSKAKNTRLVEIQHHHAHIASCMCENNLKNQKVIGVAFDGTGFGSDETLWGAEFLVADYRDFKRVGHFNNIALIGGSQAIKEPWRLGLAYLYDVYKGAFLKLDIDFVQRLDKKNWLIFKKMLEANINTPLASSAGRLFDCVSSLAGIRDVVEYEGQAAIELEKAIGNNKSDKKYNYQINTKDGVFIIDFALMIKEIVKDLKAKVTKSEISLKFHNSVVGVIVDACKKIRNKTKINIVALSGGVFLNKYISGNVLLALNATGFRVITQKRVSTGDAGICLGQVVIANFQGAN